MMKSTVAILALCLSPGLAVAGDDHDGHGHGDHSEHASEGHDDHGHEDDHAHDDAHGHEDDHAHGDDDADGPDEDDAHLTEMAGVRFLHPWGVMNGSDLQVYIEIDNTSEQELVLTGGETAHGDLRLVATDPSSGEGMSIASIPVSAGREMDLFPGELYLLLKDAPDLHEGDHLEAHLVVAPLGEVGIEIEIYAPGTTEHPHAGHQH